MLRAGNISDEDIAFFGFDCDSDLYFFSGVPSKEGMHGVPFLKIYNYHDAEKSKFAFYFSTKHKEGNDEIETLHQFGIENKVDRYSPYPDIKFDLTYDNLTMLATWLKGEIMSISKINESLTNLGISSKVKKKFDKKDPVSNISEILPPEKFIEFYFDRVKKDIQEHVSDTCKFAYHHQFMKFTSSHTLAVNLDISGGYFYIGIQKYDYQDNEWLINRIAYNSDKFISCAFEEKNADKTDVVYLPNRFSEGHSIKYKLTTTMIDSIVKWMIKDSGCEAIANIPLTEKYLNLGLSSKVRKRFDDKDPIADITILDKEDFFALCGREFSKSEYVRETRKGLYNEKQDWDFYYVFVDKSLKFTSDVIYIRVEDNGTRFRAYASLGGATMTYKIGAFHKYRLALHDIDLSDNEISSIIENNVYFALTYENILKLREFFEKIFKGEIDDEWFDKESIREYELRSKVVNENNLGLNKKVQKKFNDNDPIGEITVLEKDDFFTFCDRVFSESEFVTDTKKGIYNAARDWDFFYVHFMTPERYSSTIYIRVEDGGSNFCAYGVIESAEVYFPIGKFQPIRDTLFTETDLTDGEIFDIINEKIHFSLTYDNIIKAREFFEKLIKDGNPENWTFTDTIDDLLKRTKTINENKLGLNKKIQKKFNDTDAIDNVTIMDKDTFIFFAIEYISSHTKYEFMHEITKNLEFTELYKVTVLRFWNYEARKGLSVFVNEDTFAVIDIDGHWNSYTDCFNFGEKTLPSATKLFSTFDGAKNKIIKLTSYNLAEEVKDCADKNLLLHESDLGLNKKIQKKFNDNVEDKAEEISELTFMEFWNEAKKKKKKISEELGGGDVRFYPSVEDPELRKLCRDENWISVSFKNVGRFVIVAKSKYQNYPKYKNLLEDSFRLYLSYTLNPSERCYEHNEINFRGGSSHIVNPDKDTEWYFKMNYYNLDKAIEWMREQITDNSNEDRLVQME